MMTHENKCKINTRTAINSQHARVVQALATRKESIKIMHLQLHGTLFLSFLYIPHKRYVFRTLKYFSESILCILSAHETKRDKVANSKFGDK